MNDQPNGTPIEPDQEDLDCELGRGQHSHGTLLTKRSSGHCLTASPEDLLHNFWSDTDENIGNIFDSRGSESGQSEIFDDGGEPSEPRNISFQEQGGENNSQPRRATSGTLSRGEGGVGSRERDGEAANREGNAGDSPSTPDGGVRGVRDRLYCAATFFLTYPRTDHQEGRVQVLSLLSRLGAKRYLVCFEHHEDGQPHIHVYVQFHQKINVRRPDYFDINCGCKHPHVQTVRSMARVIAYVAKGGVFEHHGFTPEEVREFTAKRRSKNRISIKKTVGERLLQGERIEQLVKEWPELLFSNIIQLQKCADMARAYKPELNNRVLQKISIFNIHYSFDQTKACRGANGNLHLWVFGEPGCGKSTIFVNLAEQWRIYFVSDGRNWVDFDSDLYDCIVFDESTPTTLKETGFHVLNSIMDGRPTQLNSKGGAGGIGSQKFNKKMPIVFISNWNCLDIKLDSNPSFNAFLSRLLVIEVSRNRDMNQPQYATARQVENPFVI